MCTVFIVLFVILKVILVAIEVFLLVYIEVLKKHIIYGYETRSAGEMSITKCKALKKQKLDASL